MENRQKRFVLNMLAYAVQRNIDLQHLCKLSGLDLDSIRKDPNIQFNGKQMNDLWSNASHLTNDPLFGLHFGESIQLAALGIVGEIIQTSNTVGEALAHAGAMTHLITDAFHLAVSHTSKTFIIRFVPYAEKEGPHSFGFHQMMDLFMALAVREMDGLLLDRIKPIAVRYPHNFADPSEYERILRCRPVKKAGEYSLEFDLKYWNEPILTANYELQSLMLQKVNATLTDPGKVQTLPVRISNYLMANSYLGISSLEDIAANFNISPRNLQRKLKDEGVKYQDLADGVRKSLAIHYLGSGNYRVKDISYMLGYNELSAFTRAFKRWTGASPLTYLNLSTNQQAV
jgi:AraC-like DNA-binding protein